MEIWASAIRKRRNPGRERGFAAALAKVRARSAVHPRPDYFHIYTRPGTVTFTLIVRGPLKAPNSFPCPGETLPAFDAPVRAVFFSGDPGTSLARPFACSRQ